MREGQMTTKKEERENEGAGGSKRLNLPVTSSRVQQGLGEMEGVHDAAVNLAAERATIEFDPSKLKVEDFIRRVEDLGYGTRKAEMTLPIKGMTCAACVSRVQQALEALDGVLGVSVNLATERATVEYIPGEVGPREFRGAVKGAGYEVLQVEQGEDLVEKERVEREARYQSLRRKLLAGVALTVPVFLLVFWERLGLSSLVVIPKRVNFLLQLLLETPVQFWIGWQFYRHTSTV
jgi:Cu+-exporting ATPase